jgi:hypothetical protein
MQSNDLYNRYADHRINEQVAVISDDMKERLRQYLENDSFLEKLSDLFLDLDDGETTTSTELQISGKKFGIMEKDIIHVRVDKSDDKSPKFYMWVMNEDHMYDGVDFQRAAELLWRSGQGGGALGAVGNAIGALVGAGDAGDAGTQDDDLMGIAGALCKIAGERSIDPVVYFNKLSKTFSESKGESLVEFLETEYSGRAEAAILNMFRQKVDPSWERGTNLGAILLDIGITAATLGMGTFASASLKGVGAGAVTTANYINKGTKAIKGLAPILRLQKAWTGMGATLKAAKLRKLVRTEQALEYTGKIKTIVNGVAKFTVSPKPIQKFVHSVVKGRVYWHNLDKAGKIIKVSKAGQVLKGIPGPTLANLAVDGGAKLTAKSLAVLVPKTATKIAKTVGGVGAVVADGDVSGDGNGLEIAGEVLGWYDTMTADPNAYLEDLVGKSEDNLANMIWELSEGTGIWGNTTNKEELAIALIITSLTPGSAKKVQTAFADLETESRTIHSILVDELGGNLEDIATTWWSACTGENIGEHPKIDLMYGKLTKKK